MTSARLTCRRRRCIADTTINPRQTIGLLSFSSRNPIDILHTHTNTHKYSTSTLIHNCNGKTCLLTMVTMTTKLLCCVFNILLCVHIELVEVLNKMISFKKYFYFSNASFTCKLLLKHNTTVLMAFITAQTR